jgi:hypothetical protein
VVQIALFGAVKSEFLCKFIRKALTVGNSL